MVDFGDAPVIPADPARTRAAIEETVGQVRRRRRGPDRARRRPLDRRAGHPRRRRGSRPGGPRPLRHPHRHRHRGLRRRGLARDADVPARRGRATSIRERYVQIGLRGYWPGEAEFAWQAERGITSFFMHDVRDLGIREVVERTVGVVGDGPGLPLGGRGRARPGVRARDRDARARRDDLGRPALGLPRRWPQRLEIVGADVVEVIPTAVGSADVTALVAERIVREIVTGIALRRRD